MQLRPLIDLNIGSEDKQHCPLGTDVAKKQFLGRTAEAGKYASGRVTVSLLKPET
jgi:hypothetical protein